MRIPVSRSWRNELIRASANPDVAVGVAHALSEQSGHHDDERDHGERPSARRQSMIEHRDADRDQREEVAEPRDDSRREQLVQRFDVGGDAGDEAPGGIPVEERDRQPLKVLEDLHADVAHHALSEQTRQPRLRVGEHEFARSARRTAAPSIRPRCRMSRVGTATSITRRVSSGPTTWIAPSTQRSANAPYMRPRYGRVYTSRRRISFAVVRLAQYVVVVRLGCGGSHSAVS